MDYFLHKTHKLIYILLLLVWYNFLICMDKLINRRINLIKLLELMFKLKITFTHYKNKYQCPNKTSKMSDLEEFAIPNYVSSDNSESESEDEEVDNKVIQRTWRHVETFDAAADAERKLERQGIWAKTKPYDSIFIILRF